MEAEPSSHHFEHPLSLVETADIGERTRIWAYAHVLPDVRIGADCNICDHVFIESGVSVGDRVTVKCGVQLWQGIRLENDVFVGPNATFTNDPFPRSRVHMTGPYPRTVVEQRASIGANATVLPGLRIGQNAMVAAGAVVTRDVPPNAIVQGNPAQIVGYVPSSRDQRGLGSGSTARKARARTGRGVELLEWNEFEDLRGSLAVLDAPQLPFTPARFFSVSRVPSKEVRGEHAHRRCEQLLTCVSGSLRVLWDDGVDRDEVILDSPNRSLYLPPRVWGSQFMFSTDAVLLVFASLPYDADDYVRTYAEFLAEFGPVDPA